MSLSGERTEPSPLVEARGLVKRFPTGPKDILGRQTEYLGAVNGVSLAIGKGEILGLVGESGCGKSTLGRLLLRLIEPDSGRIVFDGEDVTGLSGEALKGLRSRMQIVFQNPFSSLNPRLSIRSTLAEVLAVHGLPRAERGDRVVATLGLVGLGPEVLDRFPRELSGGQLQRIGTARALLVSPDFIVADEPVSALDVSVQAQVLNMIAELRSRLGLTLLFIAHDLRVVEHVADRVAVMYLGSIVEEAGSDDLYREPLHPYTKGLFAAIPEVTSAGTRRAGIMDGDPPSPIDLPPGCAFAARCPFRMERCALERPLLRPMGEDRRVACHLY